MGYFQHLHANWQESDTALVKRVCDYCGQPFFPNSPNQRRHSYLHLQEDGEPCAWEYELEHMGPRKYLEHVGMTKEEFIDHFGVGLYNSVVLKIDTTG